MPEEYLEAGKIVNTFGIRGEVKIEPWCDDAAFLQQFRRLFIDGEERRVTSARVHKRMLITAFEGMEDVNAAMQLKNKMVSFARADAKLPRGRFFIADIIGFQVLDESGAVVGTLADVLPLPAQDVYVVRGEQEHTIPAVPEFLLGIDEETRTIRVHLIEGM